MKVETFRSRRLSLLQSAVAEHIYANDQAALARRDAAQRPHMQAVVAAAQAFKLLKPGDPLPPAPPPTVAGVAPPLEHCAHAVLELIFGKLRDRIRGVRELSPFGTCDPGWLAVLKDYLEHLWWGGKIPYIAPKAATDSVFSALPNRCRIGIIGDWGTGTDTALQVLKEVARCRDDCQSGVPFILLHLGDVYYSGTASEYARFTGQIRQVFPSEPVFTLAGNHDMYSGGKPYYETIAKLNQEPYVQRTSFFCLRNEFWQIQAMDTGLHDRDAFEGGSHLTYLEPAEATWHRQQLAAAEDRKVVLLSHHQPFSAFCAVGKEGGKDVSVNRQLLSVFNGTGQADNKNYLDRVVLWLFGHEHNTIIYDSYENVARARCIGSSAIPASVTDRPYDVKQSGIPWNSNARLSYRDGQYSHGYAVMDLDGVRGTVEYRQFPASANDPPLFRDEIATR